MSISCYSIFTNTSLFVCKIFNKILNTESLFIGQNKFSFAVKPGYIELPYPVLTVPENVGILTINVVRVEGTDGEVRCRYRTVEVTASATSDYVLNSGEIVFKEGETVKTVVINILDDDIREGLESFRFELYDIIAAPDVILNFRGMNGRTATIITIVDNDSKQISLASIIIIYF